MEHINDLSKGLCKDVNSFRQPDNTTYDVKNMVYLSNEGDMTSITNEDGTLLFNTQGVEGFTIMGYSILNNEIFAIYVNDEQHSYVAVINPYSQTNEPVAPVNDQGEVITNNSELGFNKNYPIDCQSRKLINGDRILYFTDNNVPFGRINLNNPPVEDVIRETVKLVLDQDIPKISTVSINEDVASTLKAGSYQFITRYVTQSGNTTTFGLPTNPLPMVPSLKKDGVNEYEGGDITEDVNKSITLNISNIDQKYAELEIIVITYEGTESVLKATKVASLPITSNEIDFTYSGQIDEVLDLTIQELNRQPVSYTHAKTIEQKDNVLFLSNLEDRSSNIDLQEIANDITIKYEVEELDYCYRGENDPDFSPKSGFTLQNSPIFSGRDLSFTFTKEPDNPPTTISLNKDGNPSVGRIEVIDANSNGVEITISNTAESNLTFILGTDVELDNDLEVLASNIAQYINDNSSTLGVFTEGVDVYVHHLVIGNTYNGETITTTDGAKIATYNFSSGDSVSSIVTADSIVKSSNKVVSTFNTSILLDSYTTYFTEVYNDGDVYLITSENSISISLDDEIVIKRTFTTGFTDYIDEIVSQEKRTYRRNEVYSFGFFVLFNDGSTSDVYHIPGKRNIPSPTLGVKYAAGDQNANTGTLGTIFTTFQYPSNQSYPEDNNRYISHHVMPTNQICPHISIDDEIKIRPIKLKFELGTSFSNEFSKTVKEIVFVRQRRNSILNKSVYAQGVINRMVRTGDHNEKTGQPRGEVTPSQFPVTVNDFAKPNEPQIWSSECFMEGPCLGRLTSIKGYDGGMVYTAPTDYTGVVVNPSSLIYLINRRPGKAVPYVNDRGVFRSPDFDMNFPQPLSVINSGEIKLQYKSGLRQVCIGHNYGIYYNGSSGGGIGEFPYWDIYYNHTSVDFTTEDSITINTSAIRETNKRDCVNLDPSTQADRFLTSNFRWTPKGLEMLLDESIPREEGIYFQVRNRYESGERNSGPIGALVGRENFDKSLALYDNFSNWDGSELYTNSNPDGALWISSDNKNYDLNIIEDGQSLTSPYEGNLVLKRNVYNIEVPNDSQYGSIGADPYIIIGRKDLRNSNNIPINTFLNIYGGDTFITKYAYLTHTILPYYTPSRFKGFGDFFYHLKNTNIGDAAITDPRGNNSNVDPKQQGKHQEPPTVPFIAMTDGFSFKTLEYFFVESDINTYYRHSTGVNSPEYYPNQEKASELLSTWQSAFGNAESYNAQYSFENTARYFFTKGSLDQRLTKFENRTIYSEEAKSDNVLDSYRIFLQNNFYDLPSHTGPIWDSFVHNNRLYFHTPKSLWMTFAESAATLQASNIDEVVLGTGSLFARPSIQMVSNTSGYSGTLSQFGGIHTPFGYIFADSLQGKIFLLSDKLVEISEKNMQTFFSNNLSNGIDKALISTENAHLIDNPFIGIGICGGYDYRLKRCIITKHNSFTISYSMINHSWASYHDYEPSLYIPFDNELLVYDKGFKKLWFLNKGLKGTYFDQTYDSVLEHIVASPYDVIKVADNIQLKSESSSDGVKIKNDGFKTIQVYSSFQNSGVHELIPGNYYDADKIEGQILLKYRNREYKLNIPRDYVFDHTQDIFDVNNMITPFGLNNGNKERIKNDNFNIRYTYDNSNNYKFVINLIKVIFRTNVR